MYPERTVKSFVRRLGSLSHAQKEAIEKGYGQIVFTPENKDILFKKLSDLASEGLPCVLEVGFGQGDALLAMAKAHSDYMFLGCDPHRLGVGRVAFQASVEGLQNILLYEGDMWDCFDALPCTLERVHVFFPDPWPKKRHHKRRLLQADFFEKMSKKIAIGGSLHIATDWKEYALEIQETLRAYPVYKMREMTTKFCKRPLTKYERKGLEKGHEITDILLERQY